MQIHQMPNARVAAPTPPQQHDRRTQLLARWCELTALVAAAAAHHPGEEYGLFTMQQQVEHVLRDRSPQVDGAVDFLIAWEASLIHHNDVPAGQCLICRRARVDAALIPVKVNVGGAL